MSIFNPTAEAKSRTRLSDFALRHRVHITAAAVVAVVTFAAFYPSLYNSFLNYDDDSLYLNNPNFRGLGWRQIRWMFTTFLMGHYQPLTWVTLGLDYVIWGMNPFGYHLINIALHTANAVLFYLLSVRLLRLASPSLDELACAVGAATAALFFSIHPMRVESVAWLTERRDVLSGFFIFLTLHAYLTAAQTESRDSRFKWLAAVLVLYVLSLLSKAVGMTLPVVFLILDFYPLRRLGGNKEWYGRAVRDVWVEKIPFFILGGIAALTAAIAQIDTRAMAPLMQFGIGPRAAIAAYGFIFYLWKTIVPTKLSPMYEIPADFDPTQSIYIASAAFVIAATAALIFFRKVWPSGLAIWLSYIFLVLPVSGIVQSGPQLVAVRYSYLPCLGFALLAGGGIAQLWRRRARTAEIATAVAVGIVLITLTSLTRQQLGVWRDTEQLWRYVLTVEPGTSIAHNDLGNILRNRGEVPSAVEHYREAIRLHPKCGMCRFNLAAALASLGRTDEAIEEYRETIKYSPRYAQAHYNLGFYLTEKGEVDKAIEAYARAIEADPNYVSAYNNLGRLLASRGRLDQAIVYYRKAVAVQPDFAMARANLGHALLLQGRVGEAAKEIDRALAIDPRLPTAHYAKGGVLIQQERFDEAIAEYRQAIERNPDYSRVYYQIGNAYSELGRFTDAAAAYEKFLQLYPKDADAHYNFGNALLKSGKTALAVE